MFNSNSYTNTRGNNSYNSRHSFGSGSHSRSREFTRNLQQSRPSTIDAFNPKMFPGIASSHTKSKADSEFNQPVYSDKYLQSATVVVEDIVRPNLKTDRETQLDRCEIRENWPNTCITKSWKDANASTDANNTETHNVLKGLNGLYFNRLLAHIQLYGQNTHNQHRDIEAVENSAKTLNLLSDSYIFAQNDDDSYYDSEYDE
jgi:hypothetical protein